MADHDAFAQDLAALQRGRAFADLSERRKVRIFGTDAVAWLHDLLTADVAGLSPGRTCRALLLSPTGRIRADVHVFRRDDDLLLVQRLDQPEHIGLLLAPYVLSSDVSLEDATGSLAMFAVLGDAAARVGLPGFEPSTLGPGIDLVAPTGKPAWRVEDALVKADLVEIHDRALEVWRVLHGDPRMGVDFDPNAYPAEARLDDTVDAEKGCFLGQEAVARIRNLGHPPSVLRHMRAGVALHTDAPVYADGERVGTVTSAAADLHGGVGLVRVRYAAATTRLTDSEGRSIVDVSTAG